VKKKPFYISEDKSDYFILILLKKINFIITISLITAILFFIYNLKFNDSVNSVIAKIEIEKPLRQKFDIYTNFLYPVDFKKEINLSDDFYNDFKKNIESKSNFLRFVDISVSKGKLSEEDILILKKYKFSIEFKKLKNSENYSNQEYAINFPGSFNSANKFFSEYIYFARDISIDNFVNNLKFNFLFKINQLEKKKNNLDLNEIENLKIILSTVNSENFQYNPILNKVFFITKPESIIKYFFYGLLNGFFISIIFIFFESLVLKSK